MRPFAPSSISLTSATLTLSLPLPTVHAIRLAGRESRIQEPFAQDIQQVVEEIAQALLPILQDKPFAFLGHRYFTLCFQQALAGGTQADPSQE